MARLKLNKQEIGEITELQQRNNNLIFQLGDIEIQLKNLNETKQRLLKEHSQLITDDLEFGAAIKEKYGEGQIDFQKFEIVTQD